jgi:hypothetical protein
MALGGMTEAEMLNRMSSVELNRWMAYYEVEPFGPQESGRQAAMITAMVANTARDESKRKEPFTEQDFMRSMTHSVPLKGDENEWEDEEEEFEVEREEDKYALARKLGTLFGTPIPGLE